LCSGVLVFKQYIKGVEMLQIKYTKTGRCYGGCISHILPDTIEFGDTVLEVLELLVDSINTTNGALEDFEYTAYLSYHEYDINKEHPTLVIQGDMTSYGYSVNLLTGDVDMVCLCAATNDSECICEYENN
jgi:hypothetical protein